MLKTYSLSAADAVAAVLGASDPTQLLSSRDAVRQVRLLVPECEFTDRELAEIIVLQAVSRSRPMISFDLNAKRTACETVP